MSGRMPRQSFGDIQSFISCGVTLPDPLVSVKIRETCRIAHAHGHNWVWINTCCIDKSSSAELSEAINSMFEWYPKAEPPISTQPTLPSAGASGSFAGGWTLQELIAPRYLIFLASNWALLGTKSAFADLVEEISGVDIEVLTFTRDVTKVSVARRMSWAAKRQITRLEDDAHSLMGTFDVHMSTIYGEGRAAFRRLQEEILKHTNDHTQFA
ncbi:hypothetical protein OH76DRAFT_1489509 [Lentinus brumalis]|uniref:Uncharacterized protein n=1 Tax=Lentinus brumalis TaxID=2498619 RepID=A0A371CMA5_9APHY|nr:hypothetical protein OH76DRAFT_1489509 [Polyporus brumalis]